MIQEHVLGRIVDMTEDGEAVIKAALPSLTRAADRQYETVEIILPDGRKITPQQRKKIYCLIGEIADYIEGIKNAETAESTKTMMKWEFILKRMESQERKLFSLSNCDESTAREFITYLLDFIIQNDIPMSVSPLDNCEDIGRYVYSCAANRRCCVCGRPADIHHTIGSKIGMGNDRTEVHHLGREILPLCREHHTICHNDEKGFIEKYHLQKIKLDENLCKKLKLKK
jgi:hypothetical protein